jgi:death-on-curing protein
MCGTSTWGSVLVVHLAKNHPLPDGNKRAAYLALIEFLARNGRQFLSTDTGATVDMMVRIAGSKVDHDEVEDGSGVSSTDMRPRAVD